jgi:NitT/TauT family transport system substrate-binding protein
MFRLMVADVDSPSYFVATAAASLGFFKAEGIDIEFEPTYGARNGPERLRDGTVHFFGGPAYAATRAFPGWKGAKLLCALSQYSYWFMAVRSDLDVKRGDVSALKGLRISSSQHFPEMGLWHIWPSPALTSSATAFGLCRCPPLAITSTRRATPGSPRSSTALPTPIGATACALRSARVSASQSFTSICAAAMGRARWYNFAALTTTEQLIRDEAEIAAGAVRAIVKAQKALRADPQLAAGVGHQLFPADEAALIAGLIERDAPFYDATISSEAIEGLNRFAKANGLIAESVPYDSLVASQFYQLWSA